MKKQKKMETQLPEVMIQPIQSFLSGIEAAQTTLLSRSWYTTWLTRPNLDFDEGDFLRFEKSTFVKFAKKTMQRYEEWNRKIQSFRLLIRDKRSNISVAKELILEAMKLGATDLHLKLIGGWNCFVLPHEVLQSQTLVRLSLDSCNIYLKVSCPRLKSLSLSRVLIAGNNLWNIISTCPTIEKLVLSDFNQDSIKLILEPPGLCVVDFHKLRVLSLENMIICQELFRDISRFPCLKELTIDNCSIREEIQICSNSLMYISFTHMTGSRSRLKLDVPNIRKFKFSGCYIPSLSLITTSRIWESDISIRATHTSHYHKILWINYLRVFLLNLRPSTISLSLDINLFPDDMMEGRDYTGYIIPRVEKLTLFMNAPPSLHSAVLGGLFWSCRPNFVTLYWLPSSPFPIGNKKQAENNDFTELFWNAMENRNMSSLHCLEEVNVEFFEDGGRPLLWKTLSQVLANSGNVKIEVCFRFKWGEIKL
ncbi:hypothetical protein ACS0TY_027491 [Phlomoides rotata]